MMNAQDFSSTVFDLAPVAMWLEDFSGVKEQFEVWRAEGVTDLRSYLLADVQRVASCSQRIKLLAVNTRTLELFEAPSFETLVESLSRVFRDEMLKGHVNELVAH